MDPADPFLNSTASDVSVLLVPAGRDLARGGIAGGARLRFISTYETPS